MKTKLRFVYTNYDGGGYYDRDGYVLIYPPGRKRMFAHRWQMEQHLGRRLHPWEHVHHANEVPDDNDIGNLVLTTNREHPKLHRKNYADADVKQCCKCGHIMPRHMFSLCSTFKASPSSKQDTHQKWCKGCFVKYMVEYRQAKKAKGERPDQGG